MAAATRYIESFFAGEGPSGKDVDTAEQKMEGLQ